MKRFAIALTALSLFAGAASAAGIGQVNERPDAPARPAAAVQTVNVDAGKILNARELDRAGLKADAKLTVTDFSSDAVPSTYER